MFRNTLEVLKGKANDLNIILDKISNGQMIICGILFDCRRIFLKKH